MRRIFCLLVLLLTATLVSVGAGPASAGGWAVSTLDEVPTPRSGEEVNVGFTIRQHGQQPVNPTEGMVGIQITGPDGETEVFPAAAEGTTGHYVAAVVFPEEGRYRWSVLQGWFAPQDLGSIEVSDGPSSAPAATPTAEQVVTTEYRWPAALRLGLLVVGLGLGAFAVIGTVAARRPRRTPVISDP